MHRRERLLFLTAAAALLLASTGCEPLLFRAETVLHDDGRVSRALYQPAEATTDAAQEPGAWSGTTYASRIEPEQWPDEIAELPSSARDDDHPYFAGWGEFASPDRLPRAFVKEAPPGLPEGELVVDYQREDYVLVVEHRWKETLTDIVTIDDMHLARRELADLLVPLAAKILDQALGDEYDTTLLVDWLHQTGTPWLFEINDVMFALAARGETWEKLAVELIPICARRGLVLTDAAGKPLDEKARELAVRRYAEGVLRDNLRRRDGEGVPDEVIQEMLEWLGVSPRQEESAERYKRYDEAVETVIAETFGGPEALSDAVKPLLVRIFGLYAVDFFKEPYHFRYTLTMPGPVVATNGTLLSDRRVRWSFAGTEAYPFGYAMECVAVAGKSELEQKLLGRTVLDDREKMLEFARIAASNETLLDALRACAKQRSLAPFYEARDRTAAASQSEEAFDAMAKLLELSDEPAGE